MENKKKVVIAGALVAALAIGGISINAKAAMSVSAYVVDKGAIDSEVEVNGNVESDLSRMYYSDISAKIGTIHVKEGDFVKKGDIIISYDLEEIERLETMTELQAKADLGSYNNSMQTGGRTAGLYSCCCKPQTRGYRPHSRKHRSAPGPRAGRSARS